MSRLNAQHFLNVFLIRKRLIDEGIANPIPQVKAFIADFVEKLSQMPPDEQVKIENRAYFDSEGNLIAR